MIIAATGHRPHKLGGYGLDVSGRLVRLAERYLSAQHPDKVISGMALGWDQAFAQASLNLGIPFIAAVPFEGQQRRWPMASQNCYFTLLSQACDVVFVSADPGVKAMQTRNRWMVDHADKLSALWDGTFGGTFNCLRYASSKNVPVENLWSQWSGDISDLIN